MELGLTVASQRLWRCGWLGCAPATQVRYAGEFISSRNSLTADGSVLGCVAAAQVRSSHVCSGGYLFGRSRSSKGHQKGMTLILVSNGLRERSEEPSKAP